MSIKSDILFIPKNEVAYFLSRSLLFVLKLLPFAKNVLLGLLYVVLFLVEFTKQDPESRLLPNCNLTDELISREEQSKSLNK